MQIEDISTQVLFRKLESLGVIKIHATDTDTLNKALEESIESNNETLIVDGYLVKPIEPVFLKHCEEYEKKTTTQSQEQHNSSTKRIEIFIDAVNGIYRLEKREKLRYPIGSTSRRRRLILHLLKNGITGSSELKLLNFKNNQMISKEIKCINRLFMRDLQLPHDFIVRVDTGGYKLDDQKFQIKSHP